MKKSLVLAMAMALGVTASAYAANPFSDVPAGHWAYDSIDKLAAAGVIDGMGDGTYQGDKTMTRYEMAQIVAKAMAKGANVDKLAAEFADELDNLGVRVAKLEKKADNVTIAGKLRYRYNDSKNKGESSVAGSAFRTRLYITGKVNEDWSYNAMIQNQQNFLGDAKGKGEETTAFREAYVTGKLGGMAVTAGRFNPVFAQGNVFDERLDGVQLTYGSKIKVEGLFAKANENVDDDDLTTVFANHGEVATITVSAPVMKNLDMSIGYLKAKDMGDGSAKPSAGGAGKQEVYAVTANYAMDNVALSGVYMHGKYKGSYEVLNDFTSKNGYVFGVDYKGADMNKAGSWGLWAKYYNQGAPTYLAMAHTTDAAYFSGRGFKGYGVGANYTFAKNIKGEISYYDTKAKDITNEKNHTIFADLHFAF